MPGHFARFTADGESPGVILLREATSIATAINQIILIWAASDSEECINRLAWTPL
jgi:hypothetical protein